MGLIFRACLAGSIGGSRPAASHSAARAMPRTLVLKVLYPELPQSLPRQSTVTNLYEVIPKNRTPSTKLRSARHGFRRCRAVRARVGSSIVRICFRIVQNRLAASHLLGIFAPDRDLVSAFRKLLQCFGGDARLYRYVASVRAGLGEPGRLQRRLDVHSVIDDI